MAKNLREPLLFPFVMAEPTFVTYWKHTSRFDGSYLREESNEISGQKLFNTSHGKSKKNDEKLDNSRTC